MPMDDADKRMVNGAVWFAVVIGVALFVPGYGYLDKSKDEDQIRETLKTSVSIEYERSHPRFSPAIYGGSAADVRDPAESMLLSALKSAYLRANSTTQEEIERQEQKSRVAFAEWTEVPATERQPGVYFQNIWEQHRYLLENKWRTEKVECLDAFIGFEKYKGLIDNAKAPENLRELYIAEKIITLCIEAKKQQEEYERAKGVVPDAYMKIIKVTPEVSAPTGPWYRVPNPRFSEAALLKNPLSPEARRYNVYPLPKFIQEYPVTIVLQCDINSFMRFLHRVRAPGQFLVIRNLEVVSPFMRESLEDKKKITEFETLLNTDGGSRLGQVKDEHVFVRISAAGMDFFDPAKYPNGIYSGAAAPGTKPPPRMKIREQ